MRLIYILTALGLIILLGIAYRYIPSSDQPVLVSSPVNTNAALDAPQESIQIVAQDLNIPWEIAFLPDGNLLVTQRPGQLVKIGSNKKVIPIQGVRHTGEGGLLGLALDPNFKTTNLLYLYLTSSEGNKVENRVERYQLNGETLKDRKVIIEHIPGSSIHDGGRIAFGPDGLLYITTGDAGNENSAQDVSSLAGKMLRLNPDGSIPSSNPFQSAVYSYGHRNSQGLAWDASGRLWATEHGRSGVRSGFDEVNLITRGSNYGWPTIEGGQTREGMISPVIHSGSSDTWAPSGATIINNTLLFTGLRGEALYAATITQDKAINLTKHLVGEYGRLRTVTQGPDGYIYILTNNRDGRGNPQKGDDKIIKIHPDTILK